MIPGASRWLLRAEKYQRALADRDEAIARARAAGYTVREIAAAFGLTTVRIRQITQETQ